ncbi:hypothetical protein ACUY4R_004499 [Kosakonia sp. BK9b]
MDIRHYRQMFEDKWHFGCIQQLVARLRLHRYAVRPHFYWRGIGLRQQLIIVMLHHDFL